MKVKNAKEQIEEELTNIGIEFIRFAKDYKNADMGDMQDVLSREHFLLKRVLDIYKDELKDLLDGGY
jgi:hypothetical protein